MASLLMASFLSLQRDSLEYINLEKTLDPEVRASIPADQAAAAAPPYTGPPHPPPVLEEDEAACSLPWQMPFLSEYQAPNQFGQQLQLTLCNWQVFMMQQPFRLTTVSFHCKISTALAHAKTLIS
jgi:hypothetical protein